MGTKATPQTVRLTCPPNHKHGTTNTCYGTHGCRCRECGAANTRRQTQYRKRIAYGRPTAGDLVDAQPVREHVEMLRLEGMGQDRISELSGVPKHTIRHLLYGTWNTPPAERIRRESAGRLLAVLPDPALMLLRDATGTHRRLQALAVNGWTFAQIAARMNTRTETIHSYLKSYRVTTETHRRVVEVFEDLWSKQPPMRTHGERSAAGRMRALAARNNWVPPLGWDDIDMDVVPPAPLPSRDVLVKDREAAVETLHAQRWGDRRIAATVGVDERTVLRIRQRLGLPGWRKEQQEAA